ncbi:MAG TPA: metallophosphoesterase [Roseiflexaceae bacterium]|nr:metallophosphoesterase [Roseiflexaceae bacterium]
MGRFWRWLGWLLELLAAVMVLRWLALRLRRVLLIPTDDSTAPLGPDQVAPRIRRLIVSDLHLGAGDRLDDFAADEAFSSFVRSYALSHGPTDLILAGDTFEFLQVRLPDLGDYEWSGAAAERRLGVILAAHPEPVAALRAFVAAPGNQLTLLIGNHDFELHYTAAKRLLYQSLGLPDGDPRLRFGISYEGGGIYLVHGNQFDRWNRFVRFEGISQPFEVVRGTRVVKDVINPLEDDPLDIAPQIDNVKPASAFFWYLLALPRLRRADVRRFVVRGLMLLFRSSGAGHGYAAPTVLEVRRELLGGPTEARPREATLEAIYAAEPALRQAAAATHGGVEPELPARPRPDLDDYLKDLLQRIFRQEPEQATEAEEELQREAAQQLDREIHAFNDEVTRAVAEVAAQPEHTGQTLFVCGHTHLAQVVLLNERQKYVNIGTWTAVLHHVADESGYEQRFPFLEVLYAPGSDEPQAQFLVWCGADAPPQHWRDPDHDNKGEPS